MFSNQKITIENIKQYINNCDNIIANAIASRQHNEKGYYWDANLYSITDKLIADVGRYCESYGSDLLITLNSLKQALTNENIETRFFVFGIRRHGVDGIAYLESRINENPQILNHDYYRAIYAVQITSQTNEFTKEPELNIELKNITSISQYSLLSQK